MRNATYPYTYNPNYKKIHNVDSTNGVCFGETGLGGFPFVTAAAAAAAPPSTEESLLREAVGGRRDVLLEFATP
jgi:hypothetical protein